MWIRRRRRKVALTPLQNLENRMCYGHLIPSPPIVGAFEGIADMIQARDDVDRVRALQTAIDENPRLAESYRKAMGQ
jgi:hypothetical protein